MWGTSSHLTKVCECQVCWGPEITVGIAEANASTRVCCSPAAAVETTSACACLILWHTSRAQVGLIWPCRIAARFEQNRCTLSTVLLSQSVHCTVYAQVNSWFSHMQLLTFVLHTIWPLHSSANSVQSCAQPTHHTPQGVQDPANHVLRFGLAP
jgi:hypothetical protein